MECVWDIGEWQEAEFGEAQPGRTLAEDLLAAVRASGAPEREAAVVALARHPLLVAPWVAVPEVQRKVTELRRTPDGCLVREKGFPILCRFVLRLAWDALSPRLPDDAGQVGAYLHTVARDLHTRAMAHLVDFLDDVADDPESAAEVIRGAPRRDLEHVLAVSLKLPEHLGPGWRRKVATMVGCTPGALRARLCRRARRKRTTRHAGPQAEPSKIA